MNQNSRRLRPGKIGLYDPRYEHDACGVGFTANIKGVRSHALIDDALHMLERMDHRGACGAEVNTGDGAGILTALPNEFCARVAKSDLKATLPAPGRFAAGLVFLPADDAQRAKCKNTVEQIIIEQGQTLVGWRVVPVMADGANLGPTARDCEPVIEQLFVVAGTDSTGGDVSGDAFERKLYLIRKQCSNRLRGDESMSEREMFYICSLSSRTIIYKGMLTSHQLSEYYPDLHAEDFTTHLAMVHSRFSTNTFPSWDRAQPLRAMSHNGEINTVRGNWNWMLARQGTAQSDLFNGSIKQLFPVVEPDCSDSGTFDNVLEFLLMSGRSLPEAVMMMVPEAWQNHATMSPAKKAFYEYHSCLMEPWDGPASIVFTDGHYIGAVLDRNGLRPSRYYLTNDDRVIMASEVGVIEVDPQIVTAKGRLQPGRMFLIDFEKGKLIPDEELKESFATARPYEKWLDEQRIRFADLNTNKEPKGFIPETVLPRMRAFGYTVETMHFMLMPLVREARDPLSSMGNDSALACLSDKPRMLYDYFKQLFAQVTNPAIDSIREELVMSLACYIGPEQNLLATKAENAHRLLLPHPILTNEELAALAHIDHRGWTSQVIDITFDRTEGPAGLATALDRICTEATAAIEAGHSLIVLSDRRISADRVPIPSLLAVGAVHHHLVRQQARTRVGLIIESGEAREVHHHCLLIGYGADGINPYLAFESLYQAQRDSLLDQQKFDTDDKIVYAYRKGVAKGILKVMAKMGISTLQSYKGAQIFEAVGLAEDVVKRCFVGTASRLQGVGMTVLAEETLRRHALGYPDVPTVPATDLENPGEYHWRSEGERHNWDPSAIASLQVAARDNSRQTYERFAKLCNEEAKALRTLRGLLQFKSGAQPSIPLENVESASEIVKRFCTGAMSFGSISREAHESLAVAMNKLGGKSNTGEGGEDPDRYKSLDGRMNPRRSAIKQVASGRFGVTIDYLTNADELQIKISQGAKPGEGGELPGKKVDANIARIRHSTPGVGLISPPPHHDIYSIEDLAQLIYDLKNANPSARISVKLVSEVGIGTVASGVAKGHADHILVSGDTGGTGASPLTSIKHAGLPWELGLAETHQTLVLNNLRSRVAVQTDGGLKTGRDVVIAAFLGAEEFGFSTAPLIVLGCIMMRKCHLNTCPVGIATQDPELRKKFAGNPEHVVNYLFLVAEEARQIMAELGFAKITDMVGRTDLLEMANIEEESKARGMDLSALLMKADDRGRGSSPYKTQEQDHGLDLTLDRRELLALVKPAIEQGTPVEADLTIINTDRTVGTIISHEITKKFGPDGITHAPVHFRFTGSAGQSFGAFLAPGVTLTLTGDANDYVGKGLSGGKVVIKPYDVKGFVAADNIIAGNVCLYGAIKGKAFISGRAAERFCVRNSGANVVVEGVGDHGCEYMTGGRVVILGPVGRNFAAGMSGGIAYIYDPDQDYDRFAKLCNPGLVDFRGEEISASERSELIALIEEHRDLTGSVIAAKALAEMEGGSMPFIKVMPRDYKRVLEEQRQHRQSEQAAHDPDLIEALPSGGVLGRDL